MAKMVVGIDYISASYLLRIPNCQYCNGVVALSSFAFDSCHHRSPTVKIRSCIRHKKEALKCTSKQNRAIILCMSLNISWHGFSWTKVLLNLVSVNFWSFENSFMLMETFAAQFFIGNFSSCASKNSIAATVQSCFLYNKTFPL